MRRLVASLPLLVVFGCWEPQETSLFKPDSAPSSLTDLEAKAGAGGGNLSPSGGSGATAGHEDLADTGGTTVYPTGGTGGGPSGGGVETGGAGSSPYVGGGAGDGGSGRPPIPASCDVLDGAVSNDANGHCYRASLDMIDFAAAREACRLAGAHLVTISSEDENTFVSMLLPQEHWLGASDNQSNTTKDLGTYTWVDDEPWEYSAWREGQPNAKETGCPTEQEGNACYEHCGYQTDQGDWVDRSCWHTIAFVCEWDLENEAK